MFNVVISSSEKEYEVLDDNWDIVMMFLRMQTQWLVEMGAYVGLNYQSLEWLCRLYSIKGENARSVFEGIQTMEAAALGIMNSSE